MREPVAAVNRGGRKGANSGGCRAARDEGVWRGGGRSGLWFELVTFVILMVDVTGCCWLVGLNIQVFFDLA